MLHMGTTVIGGSRSQKLTASKQELKKREFEHNQSEHSVNQTGNNAGESQMHHVAIVLAYRFFSEFTDGWSRKFSDKINLPLSQKDIENY